MRIEQFDPVEVSNAKWGGPWAKEAGRGYSAERPPETVLHFNSLYELADRVSDSETDLRGHSLYLPSRDLIRRGKGVAFNQDEKVADTIQTARYGWREGRERLMEWYAKLEKEWRKRISSDTFMNSLSGFEVDVAAHLTGQPEQMMSLRQGQTRSKSVDVTVDVNVRCSACGRRHHDVAPTDPNWVLVRGAAITMLTKALIKAGYKPRLTARTTSLYYGNILTREAVRDLKRSDETYGNPFLVTVNVPIMEPGEVFDVDRVNFAMSHDSMVRRLMWRAEEVHLMEHRLGGRVPKWTDREEIQTVGNVPLAFAHREEYASNLGEGDIHVPSIPYVEDVKTFVGRNFGNSRQSRGPAEKFADRGQEYVDHAQAMIDLADDYRGSFEDETTAISWVFAHLEKSGVRFE